MHMLSCVNMSTGPESREDFEKRWSDNIRGDCEVPASTGLIFAGCWQLADDRSIVWRYVVHNLGVKHVVRALTKKKNTRLKTSSSKIRHLDGTLQVSYAKKVFLHQIKFFTHFVDQLLPGTLLLQRISIHAQYSYQTKNYIKQLVYAEWQCNSTLKTEQTGSHNTIAYCSRLLCIPAGIIRSVTWDCKMCIVLSQYRAAQIALNARIGISSSVSVQCLRPSSELLLTTKTSLFSLLTALKRHFFKLRGKKEIFEICFNPITCNGVRQLHLKVLNVIQV